jgi:hypothetical protein
MSELALAALGAALNLAWAIWNRRRSKQADARLLLASGLEAEAQPRVEFDGYQCAACGWSHSVAGRAQRVVDATVMHTCGRFRTTHIHAECLKCNGCYCARTKQPL